MGYVFSVSFRASEASRGISPLSVSGRRDFSARPRLWRGLGRNDIPACQQAGFREHAKQVLMGEGRGEGEKGLEHPCIPPHPGPLPQGERELKLPLVGRRAGASLRKAFWGVGGLASLQVTGRGRGDEQDTWSAGNVKFPLDLPTDPGYSTIRRGRRPFSH